MSDYLLAGVDEAGRGALAGPVVCAAVILGNDMSPHQLTDSKLLGAQKRHQLAQEIKRDSLCWSIGTGSVEEIDRINILQSTLLAMQRAVESLKFRPHHVLVDGNRVPNLAVSVQAVVKGDLHVPVISAASILAKDTRDKMMHQYASDHPAYAFESNVGYGTAAHLAALARYGATSLHRNSFAPVREVIGRNDLRGLS